MADLISDTAGRVPAAKIDLVAGTASARTQALGLCCLSRGASIQASALACAARNGDFHPAGTNPNRCAPLPVIR